MAWTTPLTAVANGLLTAVQYNQSIRDNLLATAPALATIAGSHFCATGTNAIAERVTSSASVSASETTSSTTYTNLATFGPQVVVSCSKAIVLIQARSRNVPGASAGSYVSYAVSGSTTIAASDNVMTSVNGLTSNNAERLGTASFVSLTPGSNTFTMKYKCQPGINPAQFEQREIVVIPL